MPDGFSAMLDRASMSHTSPELDADTVAAALAGLTQARKTLPAKLFYDAEGCRLFGEITRLPEYYPTRTERRLLDRIAREVAQEVPPGAALIEYGGSDEAKAAVLLASLGSPAAYVPIDIAAEALDAMAARMAHTHPGLPVLPVCCDFLAPFSLPAGVAGTTRFGFFPGSTIGNLDPDAAAQFLRQARITLSEGTDEDDDRALFLVGVDTRKDPALLVPAYDDAAGVTAAFNLNLLTRLNREAGADFDLSAFAHRALWNEAEGRIEMHLVSRQPQAVQVAGQRLFFARGETIHTENSYKHSPDGFRALARSAGWQPRRMWTDPDRLFSVHLLQAGAA